LFHGAQVLSEKLHVLHLVCIEPSAVAQFLLLEFVFLFLASFLVRFLFLFGLDQAISDHAIEEEYGVFEGIRGQVSGRFLVLPQPWVTPEAHQSDLVVVLCKEGDVAVGLMLGSK
jgi:hypothetical protein